MPNFSCIATGSGAGIIDWEDSDLPTIFGYESLVGEEFRVLIPHCIHSMHSKFIQRWQKSGKSRILGHERIIDLIHHDGHTLCMRIMIEHITAKNSLVVHLARVDPFKDRSLLFSLMFPEAIAHKIENGTMTDDIEQYSNITVVLCDISNFTSLSECALPIEVAQLMRGLYQLFDSIVMGFTDVIKIETVGDSYMCAVGIGQPDSESTHKNSARIGIELALMLSDSGDNYLDMHRKENNMVSSDVVHIRTGVHAGEVAAGVFEHTMPRYHLYGDTVNTTARLQTAANPGEIMVSVLTLELAGVHLFIASPTMRIVAKGKRLPLEAVVVTSISKFWGSFSPLHSPSPLSCNSRTAFERDWPTPKLLHEETIMELPSPSHISADKLTKLIIPPS
jgi:class 3 adenylate cyclase